MVAEVETNDGFVAVCIARAAAEAETGDLWRTTQTRT
jgi:hypothetical protein